MKPTNIPKFIINFAFILSIILGATKPLTHISLIEVFMPIIIAFAGLYAMAWIIIKT